MYNYIVSFNKLLLTLMKVYKNAQICYNYSLK